MAHLVLVVNRVIDAPVSCAQEEPGFPRSAGKSECAAPSDPTSTLERLREQAEAFAGMVDSLLPKDGSTLTPERLAELAEEFAGLVGARIGAAETGRKRLAVV